MSAPSRCSPARTLGHDETITIATLALVFIQIASASIVIGSSTFTPAKLRLHGGSRSMRVGAAVRHPVDCLAALCASLQADVEESP